jgi:hypothetical protein
MYYQCFAVDGCAYTLAFSPEVSPSLALEWLKLVQQWKRNSPLADSVRLSAGEVFRRESPVGPIVIKRRYEEGLKGLLVLLRLRETQLHRSYRLGLKALDNNLNTPAPLCYIVARRGLGYETILINRLAEGLNPWMVLPNRRLATRMLESLGRELANWHASGLRDRDLKGPNLLFNPKSCIQTILDLAGVHEFRPVPSLRIRANDLGRLHTGGRSAGLEPAQWKLLLDAYLEQSEKRGIAVDDTETFFGMIERYVSRKLRRNLRRNRPIY